MCVWRPIHNEGESFLNLVCLIGMGHDCESANRLQLGAVVV